jgi:hypothetical protein
MLAAFAEEPRTAFQIASAIKWSSDGKNWENLPPLHRRMAMTETLAHLEMLFAQGGLDKTELDGMIWYSPKKYNYHKDPSK